MVFMYYTIYSIPIQYVDNSRWYHTICTNDETSNDWSERWICVECIDKKIILVF